MSFFHYFYFMCNFNLITFYFFDFILQNTAFIISLHTQIACHTIKCLSIIFHA